MNILRLAFNAFVVITVLGLMLLGGFTASEWIWMHVR